MWHALAVFWGGVAQGSAAANEAADIPELDGSQPHWVYAWFTRKAVRLASGTRFEGTVEADGYGWYPVLPAGRHAAPLGRVQKYVGFAALETVPETDAATLFVVREQGPLGWLADRSPLRVTLNVVDCTDLVQQNGALYTLPLPESSNKPVVVLEWAPAGRYGDGVLSVEHIIVTAAVADLRKVKQTGVKLGRNSADSINPQLPLASTPGNQHHLALYHHGLLKTFYI